MRRSYRFPLQAYVMRCHARLALRQYPEALADVREAERLDPGGEGGAAYWQRYNV